MNNSKQNSVDDIVNELLGSIPQTQTSEVRLPSLGKIYGLESDIVHVRGMTFEDEKALLAARSRGQAVDMLISRCVEENINPRDLIPEDKIFLVVNIRVLSIGSEYTVKINCGNCEESSNLTIDVTDAFPVRYPEEALPRAREVLLPTIKKKALVRLASSEELENPEKNIYPKLWQFVQSIEGHSSAGVIMPVVSKLPIQDIHAIINGLSAKDIGLDTRFKFTCVHCNHEEETNLAISQDFFSMK